MLTKTASELQRNMSSVHDLCVSTGEPVYITHNGKTDLVVMDARAFEERDSLQRAVYEREIRLQQSIMRGWQQAQEGQLKPLSQIRKEQGMQ